MLSYSRTMVKVMKFFKCSQCGYGYFWRSLINSIILHFYICKTMKQNIIDRINHLANEKEPFLFVINYTGSEEYIRKLSEIATDECLYDFEGITNVKRKLWRHHHRQTWAFNGYLIHEPCHIWWQTLGDSQTSLIARHKKSRTIGQGNDTKSRYYIGRFAKCQQGKSF